MPRIPSICLTVCLALASAIAQDSPPAGTVVVSAPASPANSPDQRPGIPIAQAERAAVLIVATDLDLHLIPADAREDVHALLTLRNVSAAPISRIPLQLSSTLRWQTISAAGSPVPFTQSPIATDADHTGYADEAVLTLAAPLAPGETLRLSVFYSGQIKPSTDRLELAGTAPSAAALTDWDAIVPTSDAASTALRGFGNVLWYPVASPTAVLGDGNRLFDLIPRERARNAACTIRLHLTVEYVGDPPEAAIFNGRLKPLARTSDDPGQLVEDSLGVATADFAAAPLGDASPSLFLTAQRAATGPLLSVITPNPESIPPYTEAAQSLAPLLSAWFGPSPAQPLLLLDHPDEPLAERAFLAAQLAPNAQPAAIAPLLLDGLTHAWFASSHAWVEDGLAQFMHLLLTERDHGRAAALAELSASAAVIALAEPDPAAKDAGQPLILAVSPVFTRRKAAAVWWQLRDLVGEDKLRQSLIAYRRAEPLNPAFDLDPTSLEKTIERTSGLDLAWFFRDWVYRDPGLPDLTIVQAAAREIPAGKSSVSGYLVAVEVRNDGEAGAEVPVTVRGGPVIVTERLRVAAHATASTRIVFGGTPESVEVNDGSVPELRSSTHTQPIPH